MLHGAQSATILPTIHTRYRFCFDERFILSWANPGIDLEAPVKTHPLLVIILSAQLVASAFAQQRRPSILEPPPPAQRTTQQPKQQPRKPDEEDVVRITTNLVQVDAIITDRDGRVVKDLKPEEMQISEDGKPQKITNFSYIVTEAPAATTAAVKPPPPDKNSPPVPTTRLKPEDIRRTIAIVVDDLGLSFESTYYVRRSLKKFVDEQMQTGDLVAIIRTSGGMGALQQFTSDKRQLYAAIERVKWVAAGRGGIGAFAPLSGSAPSAGTPGASPGGDDPSTIPEDVDRFREDVLSVGTLGALSYVVRGLRELPGRKSVLLVSDGFRLMDNKDLGRNRRVLDSLRVLTDQANRASVTIYTMDARGLQTLGLTAADSTAGMRPDQVAEQIAIRQSTFSESQDGLIVLAQQTGGLSIRNNNDLSGGIRRVLEDQRGYYLIGYRPDQSTFDPKTGRRTFHHLSLKVTRPGKFNVRMRNGFFGVTDEEATPPQTPVQRMIGALVSPFGAAGVHLQLTSLFTNEAKTGSVMRSMLHIDAKDLTFTDESDGWHKCLFDVLAVTFGDNGVPVDQLGRTHTVRVRGDTFKRVLRDGFVYALIASPPGAQAPNGQGNPAAAQSEGVEEGDAQASPAVRHFHRGLVMQYGYFIFNAQLNKSTRQPQLTTQVRLVRDGKIIFTGNEVPFNTANQTDVKRLLAGGAIQLGTELGPGEYVLQIIVNDPLANEKRRVANQWIDFEIVK